MLTGDSDAHPVSAPHVLDPFLVPRALIIPIAAPNRIVALYLLRPESRRG